MKALAILLSLLALQALAAAQPVGTLVTLFPLFLPASLMNLWSGIHKTKTIRRVRSDRKLLLAVCAGLLLAAHVQAATDLSEGGNSGQSAPEEAASALAAADAHAGARDYGLLFWRDGTRGRDREGRRLLCVQTGTYGAVFDAEGAGLLQLGEIADAPDYSVAAAQPGTLDRLPPATLGLSIRAAGKVFHNRGSKQRWEVEPVEHAGRGRQPVEPGLTAQNSPSNKKYQVRIRDYGQYRQIFEVDRLEFTTEEGEALEATVRLVVTAWPDVLRLSLEVVPEAALAGASALISLETAWGTSDTSTPPDTWPAGEIKRADLTVRFPVTAGDQSGQEAEVFAKDLQTGQPATVAYDASEAAWKVQLGNHRYNKKRYNGLERYALTLRNPSDEPRKLRLVLANEMGFHERNLPEEEQGHKRIEATMGALLVVRDSAGRPTGHRIQNSHNWTTTRLVGTNTPDLQPWLALDPTEYGGWHRYTAVFELPPRSEWTGEVVVSHALWGGIPQASYYFLSLYGWGFYTFWDVAIQGNFGESVCYGLGGYAPSNITDLRPLYVRSYNANGQPPFVWTPNHGGANYLQYKNSEGLQYLNVRREMPMPGPGLSRTVFHGTTADGKIRATVTVQHPRTDDLNRSYHRIRYEVLEDADFDRLAFFQLGTALYDYYQPGTLAWGDREGLQEEVSINPTGAPEYFRRSIPLEGKAPWWVSQHGGKLAERSRGTQSALGTASRGLVIRQWQARLGGENVDKPSISFFGSQSPVTGMLAEVGPPADLTRLIKGDFVEMLIEVVLVPEHVEHYLGTNESLKRDLPALANTWQAMHHQAAGNDLRIEVSRGVLECPYPPEIRVQDGTEAEFEVTGGLAYVPFTFRGVADPTKARIHEIVDGRPVLIDQSDHGGDFWQVEYRPDTMDYGVTFNLLLDSPGGDEDRRRSFVFGGAGATNPLNAEP